MRRPTSDTSGEGRGQKNARTFIPQTSISIPHLPLSDFGQIKYGDAQPDIVQNLVGVDRVDLVNERLVRRDTELVWFDRDGILPERQGGKENELVLCSLPLRLVGERGWPVP